MKIGLFGGTFNPPHYGHIHIARCFAEIVGLNQVTFLPAGQPYHKEIDMLASKVDRLIMTHLASKGYQPYRRLSYSNIDIAREGNTYTIDSIMFFRDYLPLSDIWVLVGSDTIKQLPTWKDVDKIMDQVNFAVAPRYDDVPATIPTQGKDNPTKSLIDNIDYSVIPTQEDTKRAKDFIEELRKELEENYPEFYKKYGKKIISTPPNLPAKPTNERTGHIYVLPIPTVNIDSSEIRSRLYNGKSITGLVPEDIEKFIHNHKLYTSDYNPEYRKANYINTTTG